MKKTITTLCLFIAIGWPSLSQAQLVKGDDLVSGTFNINSRSSSETVGSTVVNGPKTTNINIELSGMRMVSDQAGPGAFGVGLRMSLINSINTQESEGATVKVSEPTYEIAPFARSYFTNTKELGIFAEGSIGLRFGKVKEETETTDGIDASEVNTSGFSVGIRPGFNYFLNDNIGLEFIFGSLGYESTTTKYTSTSEQTESDFGINFDLSTVQVGISYKL